MEYTLKPKATMSRVELTALLSLSVIIAGCGGSSKSSPPEENLTEHRALVEISGSGSASPSSSLLQEGVETVDITLAPDEGYQTDSVTGCPGTLVGDTFTIGPINSSCTLSVSFVAIHTYTVTTEGAGSASPATGELLQDIDTASVTLSPDEGYQVSAVEGCPGNLSNDVYTLGPVESDCTLTVVFDESVTDSVVGGSDFNSTYLHWKPFLNATDYTLYQSTRSTEGLSSEAELLSVSGIESRDLAEAQSHRWHGLTEGDTFYYRLAAQLPDGESVLYDEFVSEVHTYPSQQYRPLNDTGWTWCVTEAGWGNVEGFDDCPSSYWPDQDVDLGRDAAFIDGALVKEGTGNLGFDLTKLSETGAVLPNNATLWSCVRDNVTGLIWEIKTSDGSIHDSQWSYSWYETDHDFPGEPDLGNCPTSGECDTQSFIAALNNTNFCGQSNWRLPTYVERMEMRNASEPYIAPLGYAWTSNTYTLDPEHAWQAYRGQTVYGEILGGPGPYPKQNATKIQAVADPQ